MSRATRSLTYRPELDGLRAVAVLVVVIHHVWQPARFSGFVGVYVFFVLSGYLITTILLAERRETGRVHFRLFYARRLLRLYPALLLVVAVAVLGYPWLSGTLPHYVKEAFFAATYTGNVYMTYGHAYIGPFAHTWSLALEEQYYLLWPVVLGVGLRYVRRPGLLAGLLIALAVGSAALYAHEFTFNGTDFSPIATAFGLLAGSALALVLSPEGPPVARVLGSAMAGATGAALLAVVLLVFSLTRAVPDGLYAPAAVVASLLLVAHCVGAVPSVIRRVLVQAPAVAVGKISYGVYLWHFPIVLTIGHFWPNASPWLVVLLTLIATFAVATASYVFVEQRFLRWKDRLHPAGAGSAPTAVSEGRSR
ncbi:MAG TPA: acyltransferase [Jatrophihabitans sp.]|uniref:acyltransferase family protein n=1 Tax=Jatrophihabitans sp. TaxID=1932789 RepID=UPI002E03E84C|nr:acyltransferase [Jatrophihabitans sp.]